MFEKGSSLKDQVLGETFFKYFTDCVSKVYSGLDRTSFFDDCVRDFDELSLIERMHQGARVLDNYLPGTFSENVDVIKKIAPLLEDNFAGMILPSYIQLFGLDDFDIAMDGMKFLTPFSSSEFAVRPFIKKFPEEVFNLFYEWSNDDNEHVRRWCSEGTRTRLPWGAKLTVCIQNPDLALPILQKLRADDSLYVRKSVANHLNDQTKDNPEWVLDVLGSWDQSNKHTAWITKRALRTLIKEGNPRTFGFLGFESNPELVVTDFSLSKGCIELGEAQNFSFELSSKKEVPQKLAIDYRVFYVKANGKLAGKVFKLKEVNLGKSELIKIEKNHSFEDFTTRKHYSGIHKIELIINGVTYAEQEFELKV